MMTSQKGITPLVLVIVIFFALVGAFYLGSKYPSSNIAPIGTSEPSSTPKEKPSPSTAPKTVIPSQSPKPSPKPSSAAVVPFDYGDYYWKMFPGDIPVYPGAKRSTFYPQGQCKEELLKINPNCLQTNFMFKVSNTSVESVVNWYVTNPAPGWTYRGVYGDQRDYQFGDIYKNAKDIYYRMEYKYPNPDKHEVEIYYNGPYPYSDLSPNP